MPKSVTHWATSNSGTANMRVMKIWKKWSVQTILMKMETSSWPPIRNKKMMRKRKTVRWWMRINSVDFTDMCFYLLIDVWVFDYSYVVIILLRLPYKLACLDVLGRNLLWRLARQPILWWGMSWFYCWFRPRQWWAWGYD